MTNAGGNGWVGVRSGSFDVVRSDKVLKVIFLDKSFDLPFFVVLTIIALLLSIPPGLRWGPAIAWTSILAFVILLRWLRLRWFVQRCVGAAFDEWIAMTKVA